MRADLGHVAPAQSVFFLGEHDDRSAFRRLVGEARKLRRIRQRLGAGAVDRNEFGRHAIAKRDRSGLIQQQRVDVARGFDGAPAHRQTFLRSKRSMPAMPMAESSPPIVVGIKQTSKATITVTETLAMPE